METELLGMTATDELREMLDERGIGHYDVDINSGVRTTQWENGGKRDVRYEEWSSGTTRLDASNVTPEQAIAATVGPLITEDTSDGWHSFKDLYHHRALLFSVIVHNYRDMCWKSKKHHDGKELDWNFIVGIDTPWGQASYHYGMEYWDLFDCKELEQAPYYDGYTADESVARIARLRELDSGRGTCEAVAMDCAGNAPYNTSGLSLNFETVGCSECGAPWPVTLYRQGIVACPFCGRRVIKR